MQCFPPWPGANTYEKFSIALAFNKVCQCLLPVVSVNADGIKIILAPAFAQMDKRHQYVASSLGLCPFKRLLRVSLPILAVPVGAALFIGFAVSIALYLPTVFVGGGRIATITVEAVSLAANGSRGPAGVAAILQLLIPLGCYIIIWLFLRYRHGKFANLRGGGLI